MVTALEPTDHIVPVPDAAGDRNARTRTIRLAGDHLAAARGETTGHTAVTRHATVTDHPAVTGHPGVRGATTSVPSPAPAGHLVPSTA
ncbi:MULTISPECIES: hypothetical protein [Streptomyces]|uniref:Uncharacterized protein n=1 Tax=Streptomyces flaveolus TaxID=67297 RepID=A0ABV3AIC3_9ACTN|nr:MULTISPECIES: hypothetical protein [Streptomyces]KOG60291.1 hypothetical protein ADK77_35970 [Streptomyces antibioticus]MBG7699806.1 hypothetical protein [Streptomyces sp. MC1]